MAAQRVAGVCFLKINGAQYSLRGKFTYSPFSSQKEGIAGQDQVHGYKETPVVPSVKASLTDLGGVSVQALQALAGITLTAELANGKVVILRDAWCKGQINVDSEEGSYDAEFEGMSCTELTK